MATDLHEGFFQAARKISTCFDRQKLVRFSYKKNWGCACVKNSDINLSRKRDFANLDEGGMCEGQISTP